MQTNDSGHVAGGSYPANYEILRAQLQHECFAEQLIEELIVAHRAHDDLVKALQQLYTFNACRMTDADIDEDPRMKRARAALAKAGVK